MRRFKIILNLIFLLFFTIIAALPLKNIYANQQIKILEATDRGVTIQFNPAVEQIDTVRLNNSDYFKIYFNNAALTGEPGDPLIPVRIINVGIPLGSEVDINILSTEFKEINGKILPAPEIDRAGNYSYQPNSAQYRKSNFYPDNIITNENPAFFRDQRIVPIQVRTMQYSGAADRIKIFNKIVFRVSFTGSFSEQNRRTGIAKDNEFYRDVIVNFSQSKQWLKSHPKKLSLAKSFYLDEVMYKIPIKDEGMYKISGSFLTGQGVDISSIDPKTIRIYNNGGRELPREILQSRPDSLIEQAISVVGEDDGAFDNADYILFFGKPVNYWEPLDNTSSFYKHYINHYTDKNVYWLTWGNNKPGKRMGQRAAAANPDLEANYDFFARYANEDEINNFLHSGFYWFGRLLAGTQEQGYSVPLYNANNINNNAYVKIKCFGRTSETHQFSLYFNNQYFGAFSFTGNQPKTYELSTTLQFSASGYNNFKVKYSGNSAESQAYIDWFEIQYRKKFVAEDSYLWFSQYENGPQKYRITNFESNQIEVYDITDCADIKLMTSTEITSGTVNFVDNAAGFPRRQYIALTSEAYQTPESIEEVTFTNLRAADKGADFIIIVHDDFYQAVLPLQQQRETKDNLKTEVVKISDIYNEFSWGMFDATAIRDFIKYAYENWQPAPRYVLLCGDGDYDYKNIKSDIDKNWIPPYETTDLNENSSRTVDDWFVMVSGNDAKPDLAIGRFTVQSIEETENVVTKILNYENLPYWDSEQQQGLNDWRNVVTMVADDENSGGDATNETRHTRQAENIIENYVPNSFEKSKIYLIEYPAVKDPSTAGFMKPAATEALLSRINNGTLILNFVGHGAPSLWTDERVLKQSRDLDRIQNIDKLPLWIAATCAFGKFDDPMDQSFAENLFTVKNYGAIALITSVRLAFASENEALNRQFYTQLFNSEKPTERLGVALMRAKINNYSTTNDQKYHLFGDPTMRLTAPKYQAKIVSVTPDSLKALSEIKVTGFVYGQDINLTNFEGKALLKVFDSRKNKTYVTQQNSPIHYVVHGNTIFRGAIAINQGQFTGRFIVPKDISYGGELGKVSVYFVSEQINGIGYRDSLTVGGTSTLQDTEGPIIKIGFQGQNIFGDNLVNENSLLEVEIADSISGVNIVGDIGHNITMVLDDQENDKVMLTDLFNYDEGNFKAGKLAYDFSTYKSSTDVQGNTTGDSDGLTPGNHQITIKAWDNFNNSSVASSYFTVVSEGALELKDVLNFPNPFSSSTTFTFIVNQLCDFKIKIYTLRGTLIQTLDNLSAVPGINQVYWDGRDRDGDGLANGVYLYKVIVSTKRQDKTLKDESIGKLVIAR